jgi:hypothetical protein
MKRTEAIPNPRSSSADFAASMISGLSDEPEVVVGAEVDDLALGHVNGRPLRRGDDALVLEGPGVANGVEFVGELLAIGGEHLPSVLPPCGASKLQRKAPRGKPFPLAGPHDSGYVSCGASAPRHTTHGGHDDTHH